MKVIYFKPNNSTFVRKDEAILTRNFSTRVFLINTSSPVNYFFSLIHLIFFLLIHSWKADVFFIRFADWHTAIIAFFKRLYRKKLYIVIGGYDVAAIPQINYGVHVRRGRSWFASYAMRNATALLPVSANLIEYENNFISENVVKGGISVFTPTIKGRIEVIPNGYDGQTWYKNPGIEKDNIVLTVAYINNDRTFSLKGIDMYIKMAEKFPEFKFIVVGVSKEYLKKPMSNLPGNFFAYPKSDIEGLRDFYSRAKIFCLFSLSEGMPNTLCEAMLCECIPVGTNVTSIPDIIGDTGFVIWNKNEREYESALQKAIDAPLELGKQARERIAKEFSLAKREESIVKLISDKF